MSGLVTAVGALVDGRCVGRNAGKLQRSGRSVDLTGASEPYLIIDFDEQGSPLGPEDTKPDFLFLSDTGGTTNGSTSQDPGLIAPIEISSSKNKSADKILKQLQAGVNWLIDDLPPQHKPTLLPVYSGPISRHLLDKFGRCKIKFRGERELPRIRNPGDNLL